MKKKLVIITLLSLLLSGCESSIPQDVPVFYDENADVDTMVSEDKNSQDCAVIKTDNFYLINTEYGWQSIDAKSFQTEPTLVPEENCDYSCGIINADITFVDGGVVGYSNYPSSIIVNTVKPATIEEFYEDGLIKDYDTYDMTYQISRYADKDGNINYIMYHEGKIYVYSNGAFVDTREASDLIAIENLINFKDEALSVNKVTYDVYLFRIKDNYYSNVNTENGLTLRWYQPYTENLDLYSFGTMVKDGSFVKLVDANIEPLNDEKSFNDDIMLTTYKQLITKVSANEIMDAYKEDCEFKDNLPQDHEMRFITDESGNYEYTVFNINNTYYVYSGDTFVSTFDTGQKVLELYNTGGYNEKD